MGFVCRICYTRPLFQLAPGHHRLSVIAYASSIGIDLFSRDATLAVLHESSICNKSRVIPNEAMSCRIVYAPIREKFIGSEQHNNGLI